MRSVKKALCVLLAVAVMCAGLPSVNCGIFAGATQSRTGNFNKTYRLTGNGAKDMVSVAQAQYGKMGSEFGYTEGWCADFVSDCAILAGQSEVIPAEGSPEKLMELIIKKGGRVIEAAPLPGDICFIDLYGGTTVGHVEIVYAVYGEQVYTIGGDSGSGSSIASRYVNKRTPISDSVVVSFVRPNYNYEKILDLAFLIDTTGSMNDDINVVKSNMSNYVRQLYELGYDYRIAIVDYRDFAARSKDFADYPYSVITNFITDSALIDQKIKSLTLGNGGDDPETVYSGLIDGLSALKWRREAGKMVIVMGDAPPLDPEPVTGYTYEDAVTFLKGGYVGEQIGYSSETVKADVDLSKRIYLFAIATDNASVTAFTRLARATDGAVYTADASSEVHTVMNKIIETIPEIVVAPAGNDEPAPDDPPEPPEPDVDDEETYGLVSTMVMSFMRLIFKLILGNSSDSGLGAIIGDNEAAFTKIIDAITRMIYDKAVE